MPQSLELAAADRERRRLYWFLSVRLILLLFSLGAILALEGKFQLIPPRYYVPYFLVVGALVVNVASFLFVRLFGPRRWFATAHVILDTLIVWFLIYLTGVLSFFSYFFFALVFAGALLVAPRAGILFASISTLCIVATHLIYLAAVEKTWDLPLVHKDVVGQEVVHQMLRLEFLVPYFVVFGLSLHIVGIAAYRIANEFNRVRILNEEILNTIAAGVLTVTSEGVITYVNEQALMMLNRIRSVTLDRDMREILPPEISESLVTILLDARELDPIEVQLETGRILEVTPTRLSDGQGRTRGAVCILDDISMRKRVEEVERNTERFRALIEMSASMAHEIRNPLASIRGAVQELGSAAAEDSEDRVLYDVVMKESDRLNKIIGRFLEFAGEGERTKIRCNLSRILEDIAVLLRTREGSEHVIEAAIEPGLVVEGSPDNLKQTFLNIGINALEASPQGSRIHIVGRPADPSEFPQRGGPEFAGWILVEFEDEGPGIPDSQRRRIFDPFFTTKVTGTGMGLAIAQKMMDVHRGEIQILDRESGTGTRFRVLLPGQQLNP